jgi:hypothetical protein
MVAFGPPHIPYAQYKAMLQGGNLRWIREHRAQLTLSLLDEAEVRQLIAERDPDAIEEWDAGTRGEP